jgi:hypothetical protein
MSKVVRFPQSISTPSASADKAASKRSDRDQFVSIALFSGFGLLVSLIVVLFGVAGVWA